MPPPPKSTLFPYTTLFRSNVGMADESNAIRIGAKRIHQNTFIAGIHGTTVAGGIGVIIDGKGHLGTATRLRRHGISEAPPGEVRRRTAQRFPRRWDR